MTIRSLVARAIARGEEETVIVASVSNRLRALFPAHGVPGGQPDMIELSVAGVFAELSNLRG